MTLADRLEDAIDPDDLPEEVPTGGEIQYWVTDPTTADRALGMVAKFDSEAKEVSAMAEAQVERIESWRGAEHKRLQGRRSYYATLLGHYHRAALDEDPKRKTISLPHGTLTARKLPDGIVIEDEDELLKWAKTEAPDYVRVREDLNHSAIKAAVLKSGEILPGVSATVGEVRYQVTTEVAP